MNPERCLYGSKSGKPNEQVRAGQSQLRRPKIRELLEPVTPQAGMPVFHDRMKWLFNIFRKQSKFLPLFNDLGSKLKERYGSISDCHKGQIDTTLKILDLNAELTDFAYILYLRDEAYEKLKEENPSSWKAKEDELTEFIWSKPVGLKNGNFHESGVGMQSGVSSHL